MKLIVFQNAAFRADAIRHIELDSSEETISVCFHDNKESFDLIYDTEEEATQDFNKAIEQWKAI